MAAVLDADAPGFVERRQLIDAQPRILRMADVFETVEAAPRHPGNEFAIEPEMHFEAVGVSVIPRQDVRRERAPLECGCDAVRFYFREGGNGGLREMRGRAGDEARAEAFHQIV